MYQWEKQNFMPNKDFEIIIGRLTTSITHTYVQIKVNSILSHENFIVQIKNNFPVTKRLTIFYV